MIPLIYSRESGMSSIFFTYVIIFIDFLYCLPYIIYAEDLMKRSEIRNSIIQTRIEPSLNARLKEQGLKEDRSVASIIRKAIIEYLDVSKDKD